ncbi:MAG: AAA family ATPase [Actinobacteria bacterium]|nr:AAA family ATPase [Actinomycetota bacterium]
MNVISEYNLHWTGIDTAKDLVTRPDYIKELSSLKNRREVITLQGIRRSGKSSLLKLFIRDLIRKGTPPENIFFLNLEDFRLGYEKSVETLEQWVQSYLQSMHPKGDKFILLDEVQEVPRFEKWVRTHYEIHPDFHIILTGSSSSLLSGEFATLLTGRHLSVKIYPFSFHEFLECHKSSIMAKVDNMSLEKVWLSDIFASFESILESYLYKGGFPETIQQVDDQKNIALLQQYLEDVLYRDIAFRYSIRRMDTLKKLALYLISNMANEINMSRIASLLGVTRKSLTELINYLKTVYLVFTTSNFSFSLNERLNTTKPKKVYCIDNGLFGALKQTETKDVGKRVENLVFLHLKTNWQEEVFYWKGKVKIDFVLGNGFPINVTAQDELEEREINGLLYYMTQFNQPRGLLISWNHFTQTEENERKILVLPLWLFLLKSRQEIAALLK